MTDNIIIWEWLDKKNWIAYDSATNQILEQAYSEGQETLILDHAFFSTGPYTVNFKQLTQTNERTKFVREMRRNPGNSTTFVASWVCLVKKKNGNLTTGKLRRYWNKDMYLDNPK